MNIFNEIFININQSWPHKSIKLYETDKYISCFTDNTEKTTYSVTYTPILFESPKILSIANLRKKIMEKFSITIARRIRRPNDIIQINSYYYPDIFMNKLIHEAYLLNMSEKEFNYYKNSIIAAFTNNKYFYTYPLFVYSQGD